MMMMYPHTSLKDAHGMFRVAAVSPAVNVADCAANARAVVDAARKADAAGARLVVTPEMSLTAYTCADLFHNRTLLDGALEALDYVCEASAGMQCVIVVGLPISDGRALYNCAVAVHNGRCLMATAKSYVPNYNEFYERRWWQPLAGPVDINIGKHTFTLRPGGLFKVDGVTVGIEICEDLWVPVPPSSSLALGGAQVIVNLSASDDLIGKYDYLRDLVRHQSAACLCAYVYAGAGYGESSTDLVFDGKAVVAECGRILAEAPRWSHEPKMAVADVDIQAIERDRMRQTTFADCAARLRPEAALLAETETGRKAPADLLRSVDPAPFVPSRGDKRDERCHEILNIQAAALARRMQAARCRTLTVGISGGLDSTLALLVAVKTFRSLGLPSEGIIGVTMPGFGTTGRTYNNAVNLVRSLGATLREIPIADAVNLHFRDIGHDPAVTDVTYENSQARERTQILMDIANQTSGMVLGTGDLSELALGWATYNGDHMSMYGVNAGVPKTLVRHLVEWYARHEASPEVGEILLDVADTPISPELTPAAADGTIAQRTEDLVGPYELHDFYLYYMLRYGFSPAKIYFLARHAFPDRPEEELKKWLRTFLRRFFAQQFKRSCLPDGPKVGSVCLSPRGDWRMPSDACAALWLSEADSL